MMIDNDAELCAQLADSPIPVILLTPKAVSISRNSIE
jgi:hypothetical protein